MLTIIPILVRVITHLTQYVPLLLDDAGDNAFKLGVICLISNLLIVFNLDLKTL